MFAIAFALVLSMCALACNHALIAPHCGRCSYARKASAEDWFNAGEARQQKQGYEGSSSGAFMPFVITGMGVGTVHRDSKLYTTREGRVVTNLTLYCKKSDGANKPSGEEDFLWITAEFWGDDAGYICSNVGKGSRLMVMGNCYMNSWRDKVTGENRSGLKVRTKSYEVLEARAPLGNDNSESQYRQRLNGDDEDESESGKIPF